MKTVRRTYTMRFQEMEEKINIFLNEIKNSPELSSVYAEDILNLSHRLSAIGLLGREYMSAPDKISKIITS